MNKLVVIYDSECRFCRRMKRWISKRLRETSVLFVPCRSDQCAEIAPELNKEACLKALHLITRDNQMLVAEEAVWYLLTYLQYWRWLVPLRHLPGALWISRYLYAWVARHRRLLSVFFSDDPDAPQCSC